MRLREKIVKVCLIAILALAGCGPRRTQTVPEREMEPLPLQPRNMLMVEKKLSWEEIRDAKINSDMDILHYLNRVPRKEDDRLNEDWPSPKTLAEKEKKGEESGDDCDGVAILGAFLAEKRGYEPILINLKELYSIVESHMVTLLKKETPSGTKYGIVEKGDYLEPTSNSIEELISKLNLKRGLLNRYTRYELIPLNDAEVDWRTYEGNLFAVYAPEDYQRNKEIGKRSHEIEEILEGNNNSKMKLEKIAEKSDKRMQEILNKKY